MNKILALTIFRAAQSDFKRQIAVILQGSDPREFGFKLKQFLKEYDVPNPNIIVFNANDLTNSDKLCGYRVAEVLIEGSSIKNNLLGEHIIPMVCARDMITVRVDIFKTFKTSINPEWENQKIFFSE